MKKGTKYHQLSYEERIILATLYERGDSIRSIARTLLRSPSTVSQELKGKRVSGVYIPKKAHYKTYWRRYCAKRTCLKVVCSKELSDLVFNKLPRGWSPERIAGYATRCGHKVSKKAVYKFVRHYCMERYLFWKKNKRKGGPKRSRIKVYDNEKRRLDARPEVFSSGHWELDFIVSGHSPAVLLVLVDRFSRMTLIRVLKNKTHDSVLRTLVDIQNKYLVHTIATDNDIVFKKWKTMENILSVLFFFCRPYHSWEKGLVENTNRWIRCSIPKKRDVATVTDDEIRSIEAHMNETPRQCLGFKTAHEVLYERIIK